MKPSFNVGDIVRVSFEKVLRTGRIVSVVKDPLIGYRYGDGYLYKVGLNINISYNEFYYTAKELVLAKPLPNLF